MTKSTIDLLHLLKAKLISHRQLSRLLLDLLGEFNFLWNETHVQADVCVFEFVTIILIVEEYGSLCIVAIDDSIVVLHLLNFILS